MGLFDTLKNLMRLQTIIQTSKFKDGKRTKVVKVRVTEDEYEAFKLLGRSMGVSGMVRYAVLDLYLNNFIKDYS